MMDEPIAARLQQLVEDNEKFKNENLRLRWIVGQLVERYSKNGLAILYMLRQEELAVRIQEMPEKKQIHISIRKVSDLKDAADAAAGPDLN